jgi:DNA-binding NarL/FixJ family response regulator/tetratricopeptide (TPR) repeat protein
MEQKRRLVGRSAELRTLDGLLDGAAAGRSGAVELVGEPGIGKTRLLTELGERADARGMLVLSGSASEFERDLPFWVFVDALDEYLAGLPPGRLDGLDPGVRASLADLFPGFPSPAQAPPSREDERYRTHRAVRRCLEVLAARTPLVLLLDDLHWADPGSVDLLGTLLRRTPAAPVLLAAALRPRQVPDRLAAALERARPTRLELPALTPAEARELVGPNGRLADALYAESGGNPFYLEQLSRSGAVPTGDGVALPEDAVPRSVVVALADELALLDASTRRALDGAAVAGDPFVPELAAAAADVPEPTLVAALDDLLRRDLIRTTPVPRRFRFRHPLVRRAVYESAPGGWRLGAHERVAAALGAGGAPAAGRAHHVAQAARAGDREAVAVLREAGEALLPRAPAGAARWFRAALDLLPDAAPADEQLALCRALAGAEVAAGDLVPARVALLRCLDLVPDDAVAQRVRLVSACASVENVLGHHDSAHRRLAAALGALPDESSVESVTLLLEIARDAVHRLEYDALQGWSRRALAAARPLGDRLLLARSCALLTFSAGFSGAAADAARPRAEAAALIDGLSDDELGRYPDPIAMHLASAELFLDRLDDAGRHAERALAIARAVGRDHLLPLLFWAGTVRTACGRLPEAAEVCDDAIEIARLSGNPSMLAWNLHGRSATATAAGDTELACVTAEEAVAVLHRQGTVLVSVWAGFALATALAEAGDPDRAADVLIRHGGGDRLPLVPPPLRPAGFELLARCRLAAGHPTEGVAAADAAAACAGQLGLPTARAAADRAAAEVALDRDDPVTAAEHAARAADREAVIGAVLRAAQSRQLAGRALARAGETERAAAELQRAAADLDACGAPRRRAAAEQELRRLGHRRLHRRTRPGEPGGVGLAALTGRELEVARLVADRRTNSQIAAELFLSPKTVETHIRSLFTKLDVSSRVEIARAVERAARDA